MKRWCAVGEREGWAARKIRVNRGVQKRCAPGVCSKVVEKRQSVSEQKQKREAGKMVR